MSNLIVPSKWTTQPQGAAGVNSAFLKYLTGIFLPANRSNWTDVGSILRPIVATGQAVHTDGTSSYLQSPLNAVSGPLWMMAQFVGVSGTAANVYFGLGASSGTAPLALACIRQGDGTSGAINFIYRATNGSTFISKLAITPVAGELYTVVAVAPSASNADAYIYVNGIKYTANGASAANVVFGGATFITAAIGALVRPTPSFYLETKATVAAYGVGLVPPESVLRRLSDNPWQIFAPQQHKVWVPVTRTTPLVIPELSNAQLTSVTDTTAIPLVNLTF